MSDGGLLEAIVRDHLLSLPIADHMLAEGIYG